MRRFAVVGVAVFIGVLVFAPSGLAASARVAALQVGLNAHGFDPGPVDGVRGPRTVSALVAFQRGRDSALRVSSDARLDARSGDGAGRCSVSGSSRSERSGWDVAVLEFRLRRYGLGAAGGRRPFHAEHGRRAAPLPERAAVLRPTGSPGRTRTRCRSSRSTTATTWHVVSAGESFFSIAARYHVSPWRLARRNRLSLMNVIVPNQRLALPEGRATRRRRPPAPPASRDAVRAAIDYWSRVYGVDPTLARALAWMESGFQQDVVSSVGALGVMQLLPGDVGVRRHGPARSADAARRTRATCAPACAICAGSSTSSTATCGSRSPAGTRARGRCVSAGCTTTRRSSSASCSRSTARSESPSRGPSRRHPRHPTSDLLPQRQRSLGRDPPGAGVAPRTVEHSGATLVARAGRTPEQTCGADVVSRECDERDPGQEGDRGGLVLHLAGDRQSRRRRVERLVEVAKGVSRLRAIPSNSIASHQVKPVRRAPSRLSRRSAGPFRFPLLLLVLRQCPECLDDPAFEAIAPEHLERVLACR